jgi:hypothetical protein
MYGDKFKQATKSLMSYCRENMGYDSDPDVHYVTDKSNANSMLGTTAHYQPDSQVVTVYISNRHPKDALRSLAHELVHHAQNVRGDLQNVQTEEGYAQSDPHMRKMEEEAYLTGNMLFRDWEDTCKANQTLNLNLPSTIGENKMSDQLNKLVAEKVLAELNSQGIEIDEGLLDRLMAKGRGKLAGLGSRFRGAKDAFQGKGVEAGGPQAAEMEAMFKSRIPKAAQQIDKIVSDLVGDLDELGLANDERIKNVLGRLKGVQTSFNKVAQALIPAVEDAVEDAPEQEEEYDEDGKPRSFRFDPAAFNPLREDEEVEEGAKPDFPDIDGDGDTKEPISKAQKDKKEKDGDNDKEKKSDKDLSKVPPQLRDHIKKKVQEEIEATMNDILQEKSHTSEEDEDKVEEGGCAQRKGDLRVRRQDPDRLREEEEIEEKRKYKDADPDKKYGNMGDDHNRRVKAAADKKHKEELDAARERFKRAANKQKKKKVKENEFLDIKKKQDSIQSLNEHRNQKLNDELMRRLLK